MFKYIVACFKLNMFDKCLGQNLVNRYFINILTSSNPVDLSGVKNKSKNNKLTYK